jgi:hypothetical protein
VETIKCLLMVFDCVMRGIVIMGNPSRSPDCFSCTFSGKQDQSHSHFSLDAVVRARRWAAPHRETLSSGVLSRQQIRTWRCRESWASFHPIYQDACKPKVTGKLIPYHEFQRYGIISSLESQRHAIFSVTS